MDDFAAAKGSEKAKQFMPVLENTMTPEQIAEGQKLAREFKPLNESIFCTIPLHPEIPQPAAQAFSSRTMVI